MVTLRALRLTCQFVFGRSVEVIWQHHSLLDQLAWRDLAKAATLPIGSAANLEPGQPIQRTRQRQEQPQLYGQLLRWPWTMTATATETGFEPK